LVTTPRSLPTTGWSQQRKTFKVYLRVRYRGPTEHSIDRKQEPREWPYKAAPQIE